MLAFRVFGTVYLDAESAGEDVRAHACNFTVYTPIHAICCNSQKEIADKFLDEYGGELEQLGCNAYLYAEIGGSWVRITD